MKKITFSPDKSENHVKSFHVMYFRFHFIDTEWNTRLVEKIRKNTEYCKH